MITNVCRASCDGCKETIEERGSFRPEYVPKGWKAISLDGGVGEGGFRQLLCGPCYEAVMEALSARRPA